ncbi:YhfX family PLP-dependent enzyme [Erysipelothrix sp. HDW6C]|uniref:alanine racemase n=1 Tax=Erysipelothrix sp. HDW6C TaxID=2714930 RepID=UPI00140CDB8D|nr:alanine racemase [Erysipelothrix sp. HDW6C]QIK70403.1 YhfX family PLP-dependent enzyme [Erysipelothrix sp. HDW6C]
MFLDTVNRRNRALIDVTIDLHQKGILEPDSYVIDMDVLRVNAKQILEAAHANNMDVYFMLKQLGRNPLIAKELVAMGYRGAVVVDFREAEIMMNHNIPLGNVGHLVQPPKRGLKRVIDYGVEVFTVFSFDKVLEIHEAAQELGKVQDIIVKVSDASDLYYSGQMSGIDLTRLDEFMDQVAQLSHVRIVGATAFPCYLYDANTGRVEKTPNYTTVIEAVGMMRKRGLEVTQINVPSTTCVSTIRVMAEGEGNMGEPGHGLTGTTPAHAYHDLEELPAVIYLSEVSHNFRGKSYAYGGGHYRRSHVKHALINDGTLETRDGVIPVNDDSIDYYFELDHEQPVSATVIMAFRFQMFVTRSKVVLIEGIQSHNPQLLGVYDGIGKVYE